MRALLFLAAFVTMNCMALPTDFVYLSDVDPSIQQDIRYYTNHNFIGKPVNGYEVPRCILTNETAQALHKVQLQLKRQSLSLKVFDCYRPQRAVDNFIAWSKDISDQKMKQEFYPNINKADVFRLGYVAMKSGHTRGSTVDLTIVRMPGKKELDMGSHYDLLDTASHYDYGNISTDARRNRDLLHNAMLNAGFEPYPEEWWHFTLKNERYPDTYFDFIVK